MRSGINNHMVPFRHEGKPYVKDTETGEVYKVANIRLPSMNELVAYGEKADRDARGRSSRSKEQKIMGKKLLKPRKKPGEKQTEKLTKYLSGQYQPKGGKAAILGGVWPDDRAPAVVFAAMITGEWFTKTELLEKIDKKVIAKWNDMHAKERDKGNLRFWDAGRRVGSGVRRVAKAGEMLMQWSIEEKRDSSGRKQYRLVMGRDLASKVNASRP